MEWLMNTVSAKINMAAMAADIMLRAIQKILCRIPGNNASIMAVTSVADNGIAKYSSRIFKVRSIKGNISENTIDTVAPSLPNHSRQNSAKYRLALLAAKAPGILLCSSLLAAVVSLF